MHYNWTQCTGIALLIPRLSWEELKTAFGIDEDVEVYELPLYLYKSKVNPSDAYRLEAVESSFYKTFVDILQVTTEERANEYWDASLRDSVKGDGVVMPMLYFHWPSLLFGDQTMLAPVVPLDEMWAAPSNVEVIIGGSISQLEPSEEEHGSLMDLAGMMGLSLIDGFSSDWIQRVTITSSRNKLVDQDAQDLFGELRALFGRSKLDYNALLYLLVGAKDRYPELYEAQWKTHLQSHWKHKGLTFFEVTTPHEILLAKAVLPDEIELSFEGWDSFDRHPNMVHVSKISIHSSSIISFRTEEAMNRFFQSEETANHHTLEVKEDETLSEVTKALMRAVLSHDVKDVTVVNDEREQVITQENVAQVIASSRAPTTYSIQRLDKFVLVYIVGAIVLGFLGWIWQHL